MKATHSIILSSITTTHRTASTTLNNNLIHCLASHVLVALAMLVSTGTASAALLVNSYTENPGTVQTVPAMHPDLNGADMAGAMITITLPGGVGSETVPWNPTGPFSGEAAGILPGPWRLSLNGESGGNPLVLEGLPGLNGIEALEIDLMPAGRQIGAFDDHTPGIGTPGTTGGTNPLIGLIAPPSQTYLGWDIDVSYGDIVALAASAPRQDIYRRMQIKFTQPFIAGDLLHYIADSDSVRAVAPAPLVLPGDYNGDSTVDAADYAVWQDTLGSFQDLRADGDGNGVVDTSDYDLWRKNFGTSSDLASQANINSSTAAVPEASAALLTVIGLLGLGLGNGRTRRQPNRTENA
jgi:hypothetical protein